MALDHRSYDGKSGRIGKLIRLLGSDKPGEVIAAANAIVRSLHAAGSDIHRLAEIAESGLSSAPKSIFSDTDEHPDWREVLAWCVERAEFLGPREREFVSSMATWRGQPTTKQLNWLLLIESRLRRRSP